MGRQRFTTLGQAPNGKLHLVQLLVENSGYAELRSVHKLGHRDRDDAEVEVEDCERDAREARRDALLQQVEELKQLDLAEKERMPLLVE